MSRIRANQITNQSADGAPTVQNGIIVSGVTTSTSFSGTTGTFGDFVDVGSNIKLGNAGVITATSFVGDGAGLIGVASTDNIITGTAATFNTYPVDINAGMTVAGVLTTTSKVDITNGVLEIPVGNTSGRSGSANAGDFRYNSETSKIEYYSGSTWVNVGVSQPLINNITPTTFNGAAGVSITIVGNNFVTGANVHFVSSANGSVTAAGSVTFNSATQLTAVTPALTVAGEPYGIRVTNPDGGMTLLEAALDAGSAPAWSSAAGSLITGVLKEVAMPAIGVTATDPDGQAITYSETTDILTGTGSGKMGLTLIGTGSTAGIITGTAPSVSSDTTFNFTLRASDTAGNNTDRAFSIGVISAPPAIYWFRGSSQGGSGTRAGTSWSHTGYNPNASGGGNANSDRLRVYGNGTGGTYAGFHHFLYSNAITIPVGHDRCDIYISSIYTNNNGYRYNQGNSWTTSQPSGNSHGSGAFGARNQGSHGSGLQQYDVPASHQGVTRYFQMFVFGGQNGVQYQEITLIKTYNQNNP